ncbi:MAG: isoprenylcysteine carboxylmethyltransferase family protein [Proteobacteria bacterium]|nr:isoprenylcysteine carboxylmethyltransferase family protein [Pseudomonadota bacterium]
MTDAPEPGPGPGAAEPDAPGVIAKPPFIYLGFLALGLGLDWLWPYPLLPEVLRYSLGGALFALGFALALASIRRFKAAGTSFHTHKPATAILTDGPYRISRNPIYIGLTAAYAGIGVAVDAPWVWVLLLPTLVVMHYGVIAREERYLERKFGREYLDYKARVRRWI